MIEKVAPGPGGDDRVSTVLDMQKYQTWIDLLYP